MQLEEPDPVGLWLRAVLTASSQARIALARRLGMGLREVEAAEHVMLAAVDPAAPHQVGPAELARLLGVTTAASTQVLHRLEREGHVRRIPRDDDRRRQALEVTASGQAHVMSELAPLLVALGEASGRLTPAERAVVARYLEDVEEVFRRFTAGDPPPE